jgi:hypothetical protein
MTLKTLIFILLDLLIIHMLIKLLFGKYKNLVGDLSKMSMPANFVPLQKDKNYNWVGTFKILLLCVLILGLFLFEHHFFY